MFKKLQRITAANRLIEEKLYEQVLVEMASGNIRSGIWAKALANCSGSEEKAKSLYIKYRVQSIKDEQAVVEECLEISRLNTKHIAKKTEPKPVRRNIDSKRESSEIKDFDSYGAERNHKPKEKHIETNNNRTTEYTGYHAGVMKNISETSSLDKTEHPNKNSSSTIKARQPIVGHNEYYSAECLSEDSGFSLELAKKLLEQGVYESKNINGEWCVHKSSLSTEYLNKLSG